MDQNQKMMLKGQLGALQGLLGACQGLTGSVKALASVPVVTPMGAVPVPALPAIANALEQENALLSNMLKWLDGLIAQL